LFAGFQSVPIEPWPATAADPCNNVPSANPPARFYYSGSGALDPVKAADHLAFYLDLYDWQDKGKVGGLRPDGRLAALERTNPSRAMILLVSGFNGCGRHSAINLLLYEIAQKLGQAPVVVTYATPITENRAQHALEIATFFAKAVMQHPAGGAALATTLRKTIKDWRENIIPGTTPNADTLFQSIKTDIPAGMGIVVVLDASNHKVSNDIWRPICGLLAELAQFVIVGLSNKVEANLFRTHLSLGQFQVGWIDAPRISKADMAKLLAARLKSERAVPGAATESLSPFTSGALDVLHSRSDSSNQSVDWPIEVALNRLAGVFAEKIRSLEQMIANGQQPTEADIAITAQDMRNYAAAH
jgi:hypothetical protein